MKTLLIGNFGAKNLGDELILNAALEKYPDSIVMTSDSDFSQNFCERQFETVAFYPAGFRSYFRYLMHRKVFADLKNKVDQVVFPGGGLFAIKFRAVFLWFLVFRQAKKLGKPVIFEGQGIDKKLGMVSKLLIRSVFTHCKSVETRDKASKEALRFLVIKDVKVAEDAVAAFLPTQKWGEGDKIAKDKLVLINALSKISSKTWNEIQEKYPGYRKVFVAFQASDKKYVPAELSREVVFPTSKTELFSLFSRAEVAIGERFHFLILGEFFCKAQNTFSLKKPYAEKVANFVAERDIKVWESGD